MGLFGPSKKEIAAARTAGASRAERLAHTKSEEAREADRIAAQLEREGSPDLAAQQRKAAADARWSAKQADADAKNLRRGR